MLATLYLADMYVPVKTCLSDFHYHISTQFENARLKLYSEYIKCWIVMHPLQTESHDHLEQVVSYFLRLAFCQI